MKKPIHPRCPKCIGVIGVIGGTILGVPITPVVHRGTASKWAANAPALFAKRTTRGPTAGRIP
jgi:hypothetical protein